MSVHRNDLGTGIVSFEDLFKLNPAQAIIAMSMFNIKYLVMHKVQVHNKAISYLVYGSCVCTGDNPLAEARWVIFPYRRTNHTLNNTCSMTF